MDFISSPGQQLRFVLEESDKDKDIRDCWWRDCRYRYGAGRVEDSLQMLYLSLNSSLAQDDLVHFFMDKPFNTMGPYIYLPTAGGLDACLGKLNSVATCFFVELLKPSFSAWDTIKTDFPVFPSFPKFVNHHFTGWPLLEAVEDITGYSSLTLQCFCFLFVCFRTIFTYFIM